MIIYEFLEWLWQQKGNISFLAVVGFLAKQSIPILYKHLGLDEAWDRLTWLTENVEQLTGQKYIGPTERYSKQARMSLRRFLKLSQAAIGRGLRRRRNMKINWSSVNWATLIPALAGVAKLVLQAFGVTVEDVEINDWLNVAAAVIAPLGVALSHRKVTIPTTVTEAVQAAPKTYNEMVPYMAEVNTTINDMLSQIKSGKYTDATKEAIDTYMKVYEILKKGA